MEQPLLKNDPETETQPQGPSFGKRAAAFLGELLHVVVISLAIIIPIRYFLIQPFYVKGASMEPNFFDKEYLIIDEISYRFEEPLRGDVVVFRYPNDPSQFFIKRIIGLPGERIEVRDGNVYVYDDRIGQGGVLDERSYLGDLRTSGDRTVTLAQDEYYLLGDNRGKSLDSRTFGAVKRRFIIGRAWLRGWPPERLAVFDGSTHQAPPLIMIDP